MVTRLGKAIDRVLEAETDDFVQLLRVAGLDTAKALQYADLRGIDFSGATLAGLNFTGARIEGCDFRSAKLAGAIFDPSHLNLAELRQAADWQDVVSIGRRRQSRQQGNDQDDPLGSAQPDTIAAVLRSVQFVESEILQALVGIGAIRPDDQLPRALRAAVMLAMSSAEADLQTFADAIVALSRGAYGEQDLPIRARLDAVADKLDATGDHERAQRIRTMSRE